jgi:hypothetical protein
MSTIFGIADIIVLLLLLTRVIRAFWKVLPKGVGSIILVVLVLMPLLAFATVSLTVFVSFVTAFSNPLGLGIAILFLAGMLSLLRVTWAGQPDGVS